MIKREGIQGSGATPVYANPRARQNLTDVTCGGGSLTDSTRFLATSCRFLSNGHGTFAKPLMVRPKDAPRLRVAEHTYYIVCRDSAPNPAQRSSPTDRKWRTKIYGRLRFKSFRGPSPPARIWACFLFQAYFSRAFPYCPYAALG